jgi:protein TonB
MPRLPQPRCPGIDPNQGTVVLHAIVDKGGHVTEPKPASGDSCLVSAAMDAVKQSRYRSSLLNGSPVEVDTTITVHYNLTGGDHSATKPDSPAH